MLLLTCCFLSLFTKTYRFFAIFETFCAILIDKALLDYCLQSLFLIVAKQNCLQRLKSKDCYKIIQEFRDNILVILKKQYEILCKSKIAIFDFNNYFFQQSQLQTRSFSIVDFSESNFDYARIFSRNINIKILTSLAFSISRFFVATIILERYSCYCRQFNIDKYFNLVSKYSQFAIQDNIRKETSLIESLLYYIIFRFSNVFDISDKDFFEKISFKTRLSLLLFQLSIQLFQKLFLFFQSSFSRNDNA